MSEPEEDPEKLLTPGEAARRRGVTVDSLARWADEGLLPYTRTIGGHRRYRIRDLDAIDAEAS